MKNVKKIGNMMRSGGVEGYIEMGVLMKVKMRGSSVGRGRMESGLSGRLL